MNLTWKFISSHIVWLVLKCWHSLHAYKTFNYKTSRSRSALLEIAIIFCSIKYYCRKPGFVELQHFLFLKFLILCKKTFFSKQFSHLFTSKFYCWLCSISCYYQVNWLLMINERFMFTICFTLPLSRYVNVVLYFSTPKLKTSVPKFLLG